jgi:hypothetical protein
MTTSMIPLIVVLFALVLFTVWDSDERTGR